LVRTYAKTWGKVTVVILKQMVRLDEHIKTYIQCVLEEMPNKWANYLSLAKLWYNTKFYTV